MKYRRLAAAAALVLPSAAFCFDTSLQLRESGNRFTTERRPAGFARAFADGSTWRVAGSDVSLRLAAGPSPALRAMTGGGMQPVFPMLSMPLAGRAGAQLAFIPLAGRGGAMLALQIPIF